METTSKDYIIAISELQSTGGSRNEDLYYCGVYDFLKRVGKQFKSEKFTKEEQEAVDTLWERIISTKGIPKYKECFYNAQMALFDDLEENFMYSEGYAIDPKVGIPLHHAFLTINEKVVDLTWRDEDGHFYAGDTAEDYFGVCFHREDITNAILDTEMAQAHLEGFWNKGLLYRKKFINGNRYYFKVKTPLCRLKIK